jgi:autotransporter family porin
MSKEAIAGRFVWNSSTLSPGTPLPTGADCAARVTPSSWEPRPENYEANHTVPPTPVFAEIDGGDPIAQSRFLPRIDGNFTGTTDEIIRWASCKWGFDPAITRARVWSESSWRQSTVGDAGQSFGLLQVKRTVHGGYPWIEDATALNLEYALAWLRSCYEGWMSHWLPPGARGDEWGCIGLWFSGEWKTNNRDYIAGVRRELVARPWLAVR